MMLTNFYLSRHIPEGSQTWSYFESFGSKHDRSVLVEKKFGPNVSGSSLVLLDLNHLLFQRPPTKPYRSRTAIAMRIKPISIFYLLGITAVVNAFSPWRFPSIKKCLQFAMKTLFEQLQEYNSVSLSASLIRECNRPYLCHEITLFLTYFPHTK